MPTISREDVLHVADLARLALTEEEVERFGEQLNVILEAVGKVAELDLTGVDPTSHPLELVNVWGEDVPRPSLPLEQRARERARARGRRVPRPADGRAAHVDVTLSAHIRHRHVRFSRVPCL